MPALRGAEDPAEAALSLIAAETDVLALSEDYFLPGHLRGMVRRALAKIRAARAGLPPVPEAIARYHREPTA